MILARVEVVRSTNSAVAVSKSGCQGRIFVSFGIIV